MTGLDVIIEAFQLAGVNEEGETPSASEANGALRQLNSMLSSWSADLRPVFSQKHAIYPLVPGQAKYLLGPSVDADFVQARPNAIVTAQVIIQGNLNYPLKLITPQDYEEINLKTLQGIPQVLAVNPTLPDYELYLYYIPQAAYFLNINTLISLDNQTLTGDFNFPPGFEEAVIYNLALRICPVYGQDPKPFVVQNAANSKAIIMRENAVMMENEMSPDLSAPGMGTVGFPWWWTGGPNPG